MLVNHKFNASDVTGGYIVRDVERLREPMQRITDYILNHASVSKEQFQYDVISSVVHHAPVGHSNDQNL